VLQEILCFFLESALVSPNTDRSGEIVGVDRRWERMRSVNPSVDRADFGEEKVMGSYHFYNNIPVIARNSLCWLTEISLTMELSSCQRFS